MGTGMDMITDNIDIWASAIKTRSSVGRGSSKKLDLYGIKKLRELILELAVRGKLVPQDPNDEPASVLLKRVAAEKAQLVKEGKIKKQKPLPVIGEDEKLFDLPPSWEWGRLGNLGLGATGKTPSTRCPEYFLGDIPFIGPGQITPSGELLTPDKRLSEDGLANSSEALAGDILMVCIGGSIGKAVIANERIGFNQQINMMSPLIIHSQYLLSAITSKFFYNSLLAKSTGSATPIINRGKWETLLVPVAPEQEQHRIVAKVDELMALCDQLEQQTEASIEAHATLVETLLTTLTNSADAAELEQNWTRLAYHFDTLFTTEHSIDQLKQTVLQLAVMGKLVPQDPNDEPAEVLLEKIAAEKAQLIKEKKIKKQKPLPSITEDEKPFSLPDGWEFVRMGDLTSKLGSGSTPRGGKSAYVNEGIAFLRSQNVWNDGLKLDDVEFISEETHRKMANTKVVPGDILLNITGASLGRSTIFPVSLKEANVSQHVTIIRLIELNMVRFTHMGILSPMVQRLVWGRQVGMAIEGLSKKVLEAFEFPVPPLAEQHRIVAKVDQLMALCDQLKTRLHQAQQTQLHLADALVEQALGV